MSVFLNSFTPLAVNPNGREAVRVHNLPPFIDGSCRREPDFENPFPAITGLCRTDRLVPRLSVGDLVIYITVKRKYGNKEKHWKFIGVLEVIERPGSHEEAYEWYMKKQVPVSQNVICKATTPHPYDMTHQITRHKVEGHADVPRWDADYRYRARKYPQVAMCQTWNNQLFLHTPSIITDEQMVQIFNRLPVTQTPPKLSEAEWQRFQEAMISF